MEDEGIKKLPQSCPMNGGEGPYSYAKNSSYQRGVVEAAKDLINEAIATGCHIKNFQTSSHPFCLADLGCSTGPNTFLAVQNILNTIELKYKSENMASQIPEFQVFFNDHTSNDFNTLFKSLPPSRQYYVAGVPGSFYHRLFPKASLHFIHCSYALHWLSKVPKDVIDKTSPAYNKGRIHYRSAPKEVGEAYATQFSVDMDAFLDARAQELVNEGVMALCIPTNPDVLLPSQATTATELDLLGSCLMDMAKLGLISEAIVDAFNLPIYYTSPRELKAIIQRNGHFKIEKMEVLNNQKKHDSLPNAHQRSLFFRATLGELVGNYFGHGILDELFHRYSKRIAECPVLLDPENQKSIVLFFLLVHKTSNE